MLLPEPVTSRLSVVATKLPLVPMLVLVIELLDLRLTVLAVTVSPRVIPPPVAVIDTKSAPDDVAVVTDPESFEINEPEASMVTDVLLAEPIELCTLMFPEPAVNSIVEPEIADEVVMPPTDAFRAKSVPADDVPVTETVPAYVSFILTKTGATAEIF